MLKIRFALSSLLLAFSLVMGAPFSSAHSTLSSSVQKIEVTSIKMKTLKTFIDEQDMNAFTNSIKKAQHMNILLDEESAGSIDCKMTITYGDGSSRHYFIWIMDDGRDVLIAHQKYPDDLHLKGYELSQKNSLHLTKLLKNIL
ncbi:hypothetical protein QU577_09820 [Priestia megaterium]|uniref:hypothetical protein n=1 Tax=Priestia megaterium TaxID=1404 RepID=UPI0025AFAA6F|nr:hypothetical protein [Priestia megaterium]MDN3362048.1 hypothetical protein [Priestia megaterium]WKU21979.1 hypothetical protein Q3A90_19675 [Priestia megaterium]